MALVLMVARAANSNQSDRQLILTDQISMTRLLDLGAKQPGLNIEYDPNILRGEITLRLDQSVNDQQLWSLTDHILATRGFTTISSPHGETISVVKLSDAPKHACCLTIDRASDSCFRSKISLTSLTIRRP